MKFPWAGRLMNIPVKKDLNMGTIIPIILFLIGQTLAGVWWAASINASTESMKEWQMRQDLQLNALQNYSDSTRTSIANDSTTLKILVDQVKANNQLVLKLMSTVKGQMP